jgi:ABC-type multidrug transport system ATPase subunit
VVYVPEIVSIPTWWTVRGALMRYAVLAGVEPEVRRERVGDVIAKLGLEEQRGKRVKQLSKGNVQRLGIAQALLSGRDLIVFDEPTHGLDPVWTQRFRGIVEDLRQEERAILIASHNLDELERLADRVAILDRGALSQVAEAYHQPTGEYAQYQLVLMEEHPALESAFPGAERIAHRRDAAYHVMGTVSELNQGLQQLMAAGGRVRAFFPARSRLEAAFREAVGEE